MPDPLVGNVPQEDEADKGHVESAHGRKADGEQPVKPCVRNAILQRISGTLRDSGAGFCASAATLFPQPKGQAGTISMGYHTPRMNMGRMPVVEPMLQ